MIDDITLAAWEKNVREGAYTNVYDVGDLLLDAITEIRRLREERAEYYHEFGECATQNVPECRRCQGVLTLAAHRAVVRQASELLSKVNAGRFWNAEYLEAKEWLNDPLVVAARFGSNTVLRQILGAGGEGTNA